jgi:hypothetical protein
VFLCLDSTDKGEEVRSRSLVLVLDGLAPKVAQRESPQGIARNADMLRVIMIGEFMR